VVKVVVRVIFEVVARAIEGVVVWAIVKLLEVKWVALAKLQSHYFKYDCVCFAYSPSLSY